MRTHNNTYIIQQYIFYITYHVAGNLLGRKVSQILRFCGYLPKFSLRNFGGMASIGIQASILQKFFFTKVFCYTISNEIRSYSNSLHVTSLNYTNTEHVPSCQFIVVHHFMILPFNRQNTWKYLIQYSKCKDLISGSLHVTPQLLLVEIQCALNISKVADSLYRRLENFCL